MEVLAHLTHSELPLLAIAAITGIAIGTGIILSYPFSRGEKH